ncbi:MAG: phospholipase D-like domain-containing protein [Longimicrobiales bacterium]
MTLRGSLLGTGVAVALLGSASPADAWQNDPIRLILNDPWSYDHPADRCAAAVCTSLVELIDGARQSIAFAIYGARNQTAVLDALVRAQRRGVRVRGIVDQDPAGHNYYASTDTWVRTLGSVANDRAREERPADEGDFEPACDRPEGFDGPLQCLAYDLGDRWLLAEHASREDFTDPEAGGVNRIMHHKFFVVDSRYVWTGSANISDSGTGGYNANAVVVTDSRELAWLYLAEFEQLTRRRGPRARKEADGVEVLDIGAHEVAVWFSPQDDAMRFGVQALIARAEQSVDVAVFYLTNKWVVGELIDAHRRGVEVRVIVDATSAENGYSKHELLRVAGIPTRVENWGGKMHMKAAVIDGEFLVLGSMNWTRAGEDTNDENTLLVRSRELAGQFQSFFSRLWEDIPVRWEQEGSRPDPESLDSGSACMDGVDNDFDDLVDADDPGCRPGSRLRPLPPHRTVPKGSSTRPPSTHRLYRPFGCAAAYPQWWVCLPPIPPARDLDCGQIPYRDAVVRSPDPHRLDLDRNGLGCERRR